MAEHCNAHEPNRGRCRATKNLTQILLGPPAGTNMLIWTHGIVVALCPEHWQRARALADERENDLRERDLRRADCIDCMMMNGHLQCTMNCGPAITPAAK